MTSCCKRWFFQLETDCYIIDRGQRKRRRKSLRRTQGVHWVYLSQIRGWTCSEYVSKTHTLSSSPCYWCQVKEPLLHWCVFPTAPTSRREVELKTLFKQHTLQLTMCQAVGRSALEGLIHNNEDGSFSYNIRWQTHHYSKVSGISWLTRCGWTSRQKKEHLKENKGKKEDKNKALEFLESFK